MRAKFRRTLNQNPPPEKGTLEFNLPTALDKAEAMIDVAVKKAVDPANSDSVRVFLTKPNLEVLVSNAEKFCGSSLINGVSRGKVQAIVEATTTRLKKIAEENPQVAKIFELSLPFVGNGQCIRELCVLDFDVIKHSLQTDVLSGKLTNPTMKAEFRNDPSFLEVPSPPPSYAELFCKIFPCAH